MAHPQLVVPLHPIAAIDLTALSRRLWIVAHPTVLMLSLLSVRGFAWATIAEFKKDCENGTVRESNQTVVS